MLAPSGRALNRFEQHQSTKGSSDRLLSRILAFTDVHRSSRYTSIHIQYYDSWLNTAASRREPRTEMRRCFACFWLVVAFLPANLSVFYKLDSTVNLRTTAAADILRSVLQPCVCLRPSTLFVCWIIVQVTLGVPWLEDDDQCKIFAEDKRYANAEDQVPLTISHFCFCAAIQFVFSFLTGDRRR